MDLQPKAEPDSPPGFGSSNNRNLNNMSIGDLVSVLRTAFLTEDFDRVEEVLVSRDEKLNADIEMERLARFHAEEELRKREELCERGKRAQERYEMLLKEVKKSGLADRDNITEPMKKISELECEVCELRKLKETLVDASNVIAELRTRVRVLEDDKNALAALVVKNGELEEEVKKSLTTIGHLRNENSKLVDEKHRVERLFNSLKRKYGEMYEGVTAFGDKDEEDVHDYEIENDIVKPASLQRNEDSSHSVEVAGTFHNKEILNDLSAADMSSKGKDIAEGSSRSSALTTGVSSGADQQQQQQQLPLSRYEAQKRRDWNTFRKYLRNQTPSVALLQCNSSHVLEFLRYLDQFGKTKVHLQGCQFFGQTEPHGTCTCPLRQAWGSLDALIGRLRAAYEENEGLSETNPFASSSIRVYLRKVRDSQAEAKGIPYSKKRKKSNTIKHNWDTVGVQRRIQLRTRIIQLSI